MKLTYLFSLHGLLYILLGLLSIIDQNKVLTDKKIEQLIFNYNKKYKIRTFKKFGKFKIKSSILKKYYYKKILCFGDNLHKIHPLAGQGLNMTIRDIKILLEIVTFHKTILGAMQFPKIAPYHPKERY